jgi:hypothetical protein
MKDYEDRFGRCERHGGLVDETELIYVQRCDQLVCADCMADEVEQYRTRTVTW